MTDSKRHPALDYASPPVRGRRALPRFAAIGSLIPIAVLAALVFLSHRSPFWFYCQKYLQLDRERLTGLTWIFAGAWSVACIIALSLTKKRWDAILILT